MTATRPNRRQLLNKAGVLGAFAALLSPSAAFAQTTNEPAPSPEGAWFTTITLHTPNTVGPFQGLMTFAPGGGMVDTEQIDLANGSTPGIGSWTSSGQDIFALKLFRLLVDTKGNLRFTVKISVTFQLSVDSDAFNGSGTLEGIDPKGKVSFSGTVNIQGKRIQ